MDFALLFVILIVLIAAVVILNLTATDSPTQNSRRDSSARHEPNVVSLNPSSRFPEREDAKVASEILKGSAYVIDGDSLRIKGTEIRLFGIDAPEMNHPYGVRAKRAMMRLCKGKTITAKIIERDHYGRTVARCILDDGRDLSAELVKLGLALDWPKFSDGEYSQLETPDSRKKLWLASARQRGHMHVWRRFEQQQEQRKAARAQKK